MIRNDLLAIPDALRDEWRATQNLRIENVFDADFALSVLTALREVPHALADTNVPGLRYQFGVHENYADEDCDHTLCMLTRYWYSVGMRWISQLTEEPLVPPPGGTLVSTHFSKGCYLDPHNDKTPTRCITFVLGFTPERWPAEQGGHLEFLDTREGAVQVVARRPPGFNTLDLFCVQADNMIHRVPLLTHHHERRVVVGWFHQPAEGGDG